MTLKRNWHTPTHLFVDDAPYFITGAIYEKRKLLKPVTLKESLLTTIHHIFQEFEWQLHHWVILDNHYHLLGQSRRGKDLSEMFRRIHGGSSRFIHRATACELPVWWNYWDYCPRDERQYQTRMNYLFYNPVKHGYVKNLHEYAFSSFQQTFAALGRETLVQQFRDYPDYKVLMLHEAADDDF